MPNDRKPPFARRVPTRTDPISDLIGLLDVVEVYLGIGTGEPSAHARLAKAAEEIKRAGNVVDGDSYQTILDVVEQLRKVEELLADFETHESGS